MEESTTTADAKEVNRVQVFEEIDHVKLHGSIDWKIHDILDWVAFLDDKTGRYSSYFTFHFPEVKKSYKFALRMVRPKPNKKDPDLKDFVSLYLKSANTEKLNVALEIYFRDKDGNKGHSSGKHSVLFEAYGRKRRGAIWGYPKHFSIPKVKDHHENVLEDGCLNIVCDFYHLPRGQCPHKHEAAQLQPQELSAAAGNGKTFVIRNFLGFQFC